MIFILFLSFLTFSSGQQPSENENCYLWYYPMPTSIICREGTRFSTACQVRVPCDVDIKVDWYWSPHNASNTAHIVMNSDPSGARIRALLSSKTTCNLNGTTMLHHFYTLSLTRLSEENIGYYWCQLKVVNDDFVKDDLLPSNRCYVGIADTVAECEYGNHSDTWMCAHNQTSTHSNHFEDVYNIKPTLVETSSPTTTPSEKNRENPLIKMKVTIIEAAFLGVIVICIVIIALLICCLIRRRGRRREGSTAVVVAAQRQLRRLSEGKIPTLEEPSPRYTPVNNLNRAYSLSVPQLASEWCTTSTLPDEDPMYASPYQHISTENLDYTSMYSKLHQYTEVTVGKTSGKTAHPKNSAL